MYDVHCLFMQDTWNAFFDWVKLVFMEAIIFTDYESFFLWTSIGLKKRIPRGDRMLNFQVKLEAFIEDVNREDSLTLHVFEKITDSLFFLIKWAGIPFVLYLLFEISRW
jgi:hypothetical protein